jgi:hypothetical protein
MTDRTEIARVIYDWWKLQKEKKELLESTITLEQFLKIEHLEPLEVVEDVVRICIQVPGGRKKTIWKQKNGKKKNGHSLPEVDQIEISIPVRLGCNTCRHEIFYTSEQEEGLTYNRDCLCMDAQDYFNRCCPLKCSLGFIVPVKNCRFWKQVKVKEPIKT